MKSVSGIRTETRRIYGQGNDQRKQAPICLEIRANAWQEHRKFSSACIVDDSFGHIECLEMGVMKTGPGNFLDDVGIFVDDRSNGCKREIYVFVRVWIACEGEADIVVIATCDQRAGFA
jgi:hypothetical protein